MRLLAVVLLGGAIAHADGIHATLGAQPDGPLLESDPALRFDPVEGLAVITAEVHANHFALGPRARVSVEGRVWSDGLPDQASDLGHAGWTAAGRYDVELAWGIHLEVDASLMKLAPAMNGMFGNGTVASFGAALTRYLRWGHGRVAWISLGVEHTELVGDHAADLPHGTTVGLRVGTTF
ncbi:MAG: hypothetical protein ABI467_09875 [Kofleriaceae bacterium]